MIPGQIVAIDYETADRRGASFEYFQDGFHITSLACSWRNSDGSLQHWFGTDSSDIRKQLQTIADMGCQVVAHNLPYEYGVTAKVYPDLVAKLNWYADTARLSQLRDSGGEEFLAPNLTLDEAIAIELEETSLEEMRKSHYRKHGLGLEVCAARFLSGEHHHHKKVAHDYLAEHHGVKKKFGSYLHLLPPEYLEQYNIADTHVTLLLYEEQVKYFEGIRFDWKRDWQLYMTRARLITAAYRDGIRIDRPALLKYILSVEKEIADMEAKFRDIMAEPLVRTRIARYRTRMKNWVGNMKLKSDRARLKRFAKMMDGSENPRWHDFNIGSSAHLAVLFCEVLGMVPSFHTPKGGPSFKASHLHQWGVGGDILQKRKKRLLVLQQCVNTYLASSHDGRAHAQIKVAGTRTNRVAGGRDG